MATHIVVDESDPAIVRWQPAVTAQATLAGIPWRFAMAWLAVESGGNPCAVGEPTAVGPDGYPREVGLFQIYNPDDFKAIGGSAAELCSYCVRPSSGVKAHRDDDGGYRDGTLTNPQHAIAPLTAAQVQRHVDLGMRLINQKRRYAERYLNASKVPWSPDSPDFWAAVKAPHAYPVILNTGIPLVTKHLGRPPQSWHEFRATYELIEPKARFAPGAPHQTPLYRALENAEWTGFHVQGPAVV